MTPAVATLRSNLAVSGFALLVIGSARPIFNVVVNHAFGAEVTGYAASLIALIFLASLPATAGLPTVVLRHVSRALGAGESGVAAAYGRLGVRLALPLAAVGTAAAIAYGMERMTAGISLFDAVLVVVGVASYSFWRMSRGFLLAVGKAVSSLRAEVTGGVALLVLLALCVAFDASGWVVTAFVGIHVTYCLLAIRPVALHLKGGRLSPDQSKQFKVYAALWIGASSASLAARELSVLVLEARVPRAVVGEYSVALSLLLVLAFAPRIMDVPLLHELSALAGKHDRDRQLALTAQAAEWIGIIVFAAGCSMAILAEPLLAATGVHTPEMAGVLAVLAVGFMVEMMATPATSLVISDAPPSFLLWSSVAGLAAAIAFWVSPWGVGALGTAWGLSLSYVVKGAAVAGYARLRFGLRLLPMPVAQASALALGAGLTWAARTHAVNPWIALALFAATLIGIFWSSLRALTRAIAGARKAAP